MPKVVNCWNEWDPLKRVIVGKPEGTNVPAPEPAWWYDFPEGGYPLASLLLLLPSDSADFRWSRWGKTW